MARCTSKIGLFIFAIAFSAGVAGAQDYKVKLLRPAKVGDEYLNSVTAKVSQSVVVTKNGDETSRENKNFSAACQGTVKVLAIDDKTGIPTRIRYQVDQLTKNGTEFYPEGTVIIARRDTAETSFEIDGDRPDVDHTAVLDVLMDVSNASRMGNAAQSSSVEQTQQVGNTWPVNTAKIARDLSDNNVPITADQLKGESKLVSVKKVDGQDVMVVKTTINADGLKKEMPDGASISDGKIDAELTDVLPLDNSQPLVSSATKVSITVTMSSPLSSAKSTVTTKRDRKERRAPVTP